MRHISLWLRIKMHHNRFSDGRIRMPKVDTFTMNEYVPVRTRRDSGPQTKIRRKHTERVVQSGDPLFVNLAKAIRDKFKSHSRMGIRDNPICLQNLRPIHLNFGNATSRGLDRSNLGVGPDRASHQGDGIHQLPDYLIATSFQFPSTLDERIIYLGKDIQRQGFTQFHPHKSTAKNLTQKGILYRGSKIFIGTPTQKVVHLHSATIKDSEYVVSDLMEETDIFIKIISFRRETLAQSLHKTVVTRGKGKTLVANDDLVNTFGIYLFPRQIHQSEIFKERAQGLTFA